MQQDWNALSARQHENVVVDGSTASKWKAASGEDLSAYGVKVERLPQGRFVDTKVESRIHKKRVCQRWEATRARASSCHCARSDEPKVHATD